MFFILSKTISYLTQPLVIVTILLILGLLWKKNPWKQRFLYSALGLFLIFTNEFLSNELMKLWEIPPTPWEQVERKKLGIILCGVTKGDMELQDRTYFSSGADRAYHTAELYKRGLIEKIFISGGTGRLIDIGQREAIAIRNALIIMGVDSLDIDLESESRNTHENALFTVERVGDQFGPSESLIITSGFHMRRALGCFRKEGFPAQGFSADIRTHRTRFMFNRLFIPSIEAIDRWNHLVKETVGYLAYWVMGYV